MSYVLVVGAYERDNFGDLLFARLIEEALKPVMCVFASLISRDMRYCGGPVVLSLADSVQFLREEPPLAVIHCGGHTLNATTSQALEMDIEHAGCSVEALEELAPLITGRHNQLAYINSPHDMFGARNHYPPIGYWSIGGGADNVHDLELRRGLQAARFISVRDRTSQINLQKRDIAADLYPDFVHLISKMFPIEELQRYLPRPAIALDTSRRFFVFQARAYTLSKYVDIIAKQLVDCAKRDDAVIVLQPAGLAPRHDTVASLVALRKAVNAEDNSVEVVIQTERNAWTQVANIAQSSCWIGTSLHGWIIATAYAKPCVSLLTGKTKAYIKTWMPESAFANEAPLMISAEVQRACGEAEHRRVERSLLLSGKTAAGLLQMLTSLGLSQKQQHNSANTSRFDSISVMSAELERLRRELLENRPRPL